MKDEAPNLNAVEMLRKRYTRDIEDFGQGAVLEAMKRAKTKGKAGRPRKAPERRKHKVTAVFGAVDLLRGERPVKEVCERLARLSKGKILSKTLARIYYEGREKSLGESPAGLLQDCKEAINQAHRDKMIDARQREVLLKGLEDLARWAASGILDRFAGKREGLRRNSS